MTALLLAAAALLAEAPAQDATEAFDPFFVVGVCPIETGMRPWSVVFHMFGEESPEDAQLASARVWKKLESSELRDCLTRIVEADAEARQLANSLEFALDPDTYMRMDAAVRTAWKRYGVDAAVREVATTGQRGLAAEQLIARCETLPIQEGR